MKVCLIAFLIATLSAHQIYDSYVDSSSSEERVVLRSRRCPLRRLARRRYVATPYLDYHYKPQRVVDERKAASYPIASSSSSSEEPVQQVELEDTYLQGNEEYPLESVVVGDDYLAEYEQPELADLTDALPGYDQASEYILLGESN